MLEGKVAVITGGTRGIGFAIAKKYLENGAKVAVLGTKQETVLKAITDLKAMNSKYEVIGFFPNLSSPQEMKDVFVAVKKYFGRLDILVNNAGISARDSLYDYTLEDFKKIMDLNVDAIFNCSKEAAIIMKEAKGGVILNTSSMVSIYGQEAGCGYPASKFAVNGLTKSLARELGKDNIRVNAVAPGVIKTDMIENIPEEVLKPVIDGIPLGRVGTAEEVANVFAFLASDMASYITGAVISVDGAGRS